MDGGRTIHKLVTDKRKTLYSFNPEADRIVAAAVGEERYFEYRDLWRRTSLCQIELDFPLQLDFELNTGCNLDCPMCTGGRKSSWQKQGLMDFEIYKRAIDEAMECDAKAVNLNFINEPLIRKDITRFIEYARRKGAVDVMFNTNGTLLTAEMSRQIAASGLTKLSVSLDAFTKEAYNKIRIGADFDTVKRNILKFLEIRSQLKTRLPLLKLTYLVTAVNYHELDNFLSFWKDKADLVSLQNLNDGFEGGRSRRLQEEFGFKEDPSGIDPNYKCPHPFQRMSIRYDGTVLACCSFGWSEMLKLGDVNERSLRQIYQGDFAKDMRAKIKRGEIRKILACLKCVMNTPLRAFK